MHTGGDWHYDPDSREVYAAIDDVRRTRVIADLVLRRRLFQSEEDYQAERLEDGLMIAAAPRMRSALQEIITALTARPDQHHGRLIDLAHDVLAAASDATEVTNA